LFGASAAGARGMLSTIAGSMMTVVGVTFSMVLVTLALASSQYTSRILRNFMRDRVTQIVLGMFAGIFIYCLIVLRTIESPHDRTRFESRLARVREALETKPVLFTAAKAENRPHLKPAASKICSK
jgi:uncharacterized membrane protein